MLKLNQMTHHAISMLGWLALDRAQSCQKCKDLARHAGVSPTTAAKLLKALARDGLLTSQRGLGGGYELARNAEAISVADVVHAVEGRRGPQRDDVVAETIYRALSNLSVYEVAASLQVGPESPKQIEDQSAKNKEEEQ